MEISFLNSHKREIEIQNCAYVDQTLNVLSLLGMKYIFFLSFFPRPINRKLYLSRKIIMPALKYLLLNKHEDQKQFLPTRLGINWQACMFFLKGQGHQGTFSLVKVTLWGNCRLLLEHFKGTKAMARGHGGNHLMYQARKCYLRTKHWTEFTHLLQK